MSKAIERRKVKGIDFVVDEDGKKKAVLIDLRRNRALWEDFYDAAIASQRANESRETLEEVTSRIMGKSDRNQELESD